MKVSFFLVIVSISFVACATGGTSVGNGLISKSIPEMTKSSQAKLSDLCFKNHGGKLISKKDAKGNEVSVCEVKDKKDITTEELQNELLEKSKK